MWLDVEPPKNMLGSLDVNSSTGFSFDNCVRNRDMVKEGIEGPNAISTGTTIVGLTYRNGVMIASDSRSTSGSIITFKTTRKIHKIQDHIYAGGAGMAADIAALLDLTEAQMNLHRMNTGDRLVPVRCANQFLKHVLYRFRGVLGASFIIGGVDKDGAHLFCTRFDGTTDILPYATIGSGGMAAMGVLETRYKCRMSESSARRLIKEAVHCGMENDLYSGNESHICTIRKDYSVSFEVDSTEDDCVDRDIANIRIKPGSTRVLKTAVHWVADMYDNIVYTLPRDCANWYPVPRHKQGEVEIWRNGRGPTRLFVPFGETRPATGVQPGHGAGQGAPNPRTVRKARSGARPGAVLRKLPAGGATNKRDKSCRTTKNTNRKAGGNRSQSRRNGGRAGGHKKRSRRKDAEQGLQNDGPEDGSGKMRSDDGEDTERSSEGTEVDSLEESSGVEDSEESFKSLHSSDYSEMDLGPEDSAEKKSGSEEFVYSDMEEWDGPTDVGPEPMDGFDRNTRDQERVERRRQKRRQIMRLLGCRTGAGAAPGGDGGDDPGRGGRGNGNGRGGGSGGRDDDDEEKKNAAKKKAKEKRKKKKKQRREARERLKREAEEKKRKEEEEEQKKAEENKKRAEEKKSKEKPQDKPNDKAEEKPQEKPQDKPNAKAEEKKDEDKADADENEKNAETSALTSPSRSLKRRHSSDADDEDSDDEEKPQPAKRARH